MLSKKIMHSWDLQNNADGRRGFLNLKNVFVFSETIKTPSFICFRIEHEERRYLNLRRVVIAVGTNALVQSLSYESASDFDENKPAEQHISYEWFRTKTFWHIGKKQLGNGLFPAAHLLKKKNKPRNAQLQ